MFVKLLIIAMRKMRDSKWIHWVFHLILAGASASFLVFFGSHLSNHTGLIIGISLSVLVVVSAGILFQLIYRKIEQKWNPIISDMPRFIVSFFGSILRGGESEIEQSVSQSKPLLDRLWPTVRLLMIGLFINTILLELVAIGNAAAIYLQVKRLEDQNTLLASQTELIEAQNKLIESQNTLVKSQTMSDAGRFLGESFGMIRNLNDNTVAALEYRQRIFNFLVWLDDYDFVSVDTCVGMTGCTKIDSISSGVADDLSFVDSVGGLRSLYLVSVSIKRAYDELIVAIKANFGVDRTELVGWSGHLDVVLHEAILVCGLLHDFQLTTKRNGFLLELGESITEVAWHTSRFVDVWNDENVSVRDSLDMSADRASRLDEALKRLRERGGAAALYDGGASTVRADITTSTSLLESASSVFEGGLKDFSTFLSDLRHQCNAKAQSNNWTKDLLTEFSVRSFYFVRGHTSIDTDSFTTMPFRVSMEELFGQQMIDARDRTMVVAGGVVVGPTPVESESEE